MNSHQKIKLKQQNLVSFPSLQLQERSRFGPIISVNLKENNIASINGQDLVDFSSFCSVELFQKLSLRFNNLTTFPKEINYFLNMEKLYLDNNQLTTIPSEIAQLARLKTLSVSYNKLVEIPTELALLSSTLQHLDIGHNEVRRIPSSFSKFLLPKLGSLTDSEEMRRTESLQTFNFDHNPICYPPQPILDGGWIQVLCYLESPLDFTLPNSVAQSTSSVEVTYLLESGRSSLTETGHLSMRDDFHYLTGKQNKARDAFLSFLKTEFTEENLLFWEDVETLCVNHKPHLQLEDFLTEAITIYLKYIKPQGTTESDSIYFSNLSSFFNSDVPVQTHFEVNIPFSLKMNCTQLFSQFLEENETNFPTRTANIPSVEQCEKIMLTLKAAQAHIFPMLAFDCFRRYTQSIQFRQDLHFLPPNFIKYIDSQRSSSGDLASLVVSSSSPEFSSLTPSRKRKKSKKRRYSWFSFLIFRFGQRNKGKGKGKATPLN